MEAIGVIARVIEPTDWVSSLAIVEKAPHTLSPTYSQSNGFSERYVQTVKMLMKKVTEWQ